MQSIKSIKFLLHLTFFEGDISTFIVFSLVSIKEFLVLFGIDIKYLD